MHVYLPECYLGTYHDTYVVILICTYLGTYHECFLVDLTTTCSHTIKGCYHVHFMRYVVAIESILTVNPPPPLCYDTRR